MAEGLPDRGEETWVDVAHSRGRRPRSPGRPAKGKTKDKDRDATPTMGGTIHPVSDDDDTIDRSKWPTLKGLERARATRAAGGPSRCERTSAAVLSMLGIRQVLPASEEDALAMASEMSYIRIPERGFINHRYGIQGRGRWDGHNQIFRLPDMQC